LKIEAYLKTHCHQLGTTLSCTTLAQEKKQKTPSCKTKRSTHKPHTTTSKLLTHFTFLICCHQCEGFSSSSSSFSHLAFVSVILSSKI
jgi:hypothetical protein